MHELGLRSPYGREFAAALGGGGVAGSVDLGYAFVGYGLAGVQPGEILRRIASGWLGARALSGGSGTVLLGAVSHYGIAICAATLYVIAAGIRPQLGAHPLRYGALYGLAIFVVMNYVVVPLSAAVVAAPHGRYLWMGLLVHMFGIGLPIALFARRAT